MAGAGSADEVERDPCVAQLAHLFETHPAWQAAARHVRGDATSIVYFTHLPGRAFALEQEAGCTHLRPGRPADPDLAFRFSPYAVECISRSGETIGEFAVELFRLILEPEPERGVGFRVVVGFGRLVMRGYLRLLLAAGPRVAAFGAAHGVRSLSDLRRVLRESRRSPESWEA